MPICTLDFSLGNIYQNYITDPAVILLMVDAVMSLPRLPLLFPKVLGVQPQTAFICQPSSGTALAKEPPHLTVFLEQPTTNG